MGGPEGEPPASSEADKYRAKSGPFYVASRFPGEAAAGRVYFRVQDIIFNSPSNELSVYRLQLHRIYHVAVVGEKPTESLEAQLRRTLSAGELVPLTDDVLRMLFERRAAASALGGWTEGHYRPGLPI